MSGRSIWGRPDRPLAISRLYMEQILDHQHMLDSHLPNITIVAASSPRQVDRAGSLSHHTVALVHLANAVVLSSCVEHQHRYPPFHCSGIENMGVGLVKKKSVDNP